MKRAFTLIELLVVMGMLAVLIGAIGSSASQARRRAMISKATQDVKEMTNAILAFENVAVNRSLESYATGGWTLLTKGSKAYNILMGEEKTESGERAVLYNAQVTGDKILDPWGQPYEVVIRKVPEAGHLSDGQRFVTAPILPNFYRLTDEERQ